MSASEVPTAEEKAAQARRGPGAAARRGPMQMGTPGEKSKNFLPSAQRLLGRPLNVLRLAFHPEGLAPRTVNLAEWCGHLLERLHRQCEATADPELEPPLMWSGRRESVTAP